MRRVGAFLALAAVLAVIGTGRAPRAMGQAAATVKVRGVVFDSLLFVPAAGAVVEFADSASPGRGLWQATSDRMGQYAVDLEPGRYLARVRTALLDSLEVEAPARLVTVGRRSLELALELPSLSALASAICGTRAGEDVNGIVALRVMDAPRGVDAPAAADATATARPDSATVELEWDSLEFAAGGAVRSHRVTRSAAPMGDLLRVCGPPPGSRLTLRASADGRVPRSSQLLLPSRGIAFRDVTLRQQSRAVVTATSTDARERLPRTVMVTVTDAGGRALAGALIRGPGGTAARTTDKGVARLVGVPDGSADLDVAAVGFVPARKTVTPDPPLPDTVTFVLARTELPAVTVIGRASPADAELSRRLAFGGTVLSPDDFVKRGVRTWMDAVRTIAGVSVAVYQLRGSSFQIRRLEMRSSAGKCVPAVWIDGQRTPITDFDWDHVIVLNEIGRIEVYGSATVPIELRSPGTACGAVLIWTVARVPRPKPAVEPPPT